MPHALPLIKENGDPVAGTYRKWRNAFDMAEGLEEGAARDMCDQAIRGYAKELIETPATNISSIALKLCANVEQLFGDKEVNIPLLYATLCDLAPHVDTEARNEINFRALPRLAKSMNHRIHLMPSLWQDEEAAA